MEAWALDRGQDLEAGANVDRDLADRDLLARHRAGDREAFDQIYERFFDAVYRMASHRLGNRDDAADLAQEVFLRVHRGLGSFRGDSSLKSWIYRIAVNRCRTAWAKNRGRGILDSALGWIAPAANDTAGLLAGQRPAVHELATHQEVERVVDPSRDPQESAIVSESVRQLRQALGLVPRRYREAVILRDLDELSYEEIATLCRIPVGTVRSRIARGREALRHRMEELR